MEPLASVEELRLWMQDPDLDEGFATLKLAAASGRVRSATGQDFTLVEDDTLVLEASAADGTWLALPQRPVVAVSAVEINDVALDATAWTLSGARLYRYDGWDRGHYDRLSPTLVSITYDHGYEPIPDDVKAAVLMVAAESISNPDGLTAEDIDDYKWRRSESGTALTPAAAALAELKRRYGAGARSVRLSG